MTSTRFNPEKDFAPMPFDKKLCNTAIERRLGDISGLPTELVEYVLKVYHKFVPCYLNMLRQRDHKSADWTPESLSIDSELTEGMQHFFSDYQHITKEFYRLNQKMDRLREIDKFSQHNLYQHKIEEIVQGYHRQSKPWDEYENTG